MGKTKIVSHELVRLSGQRTHLFWIIQHAVADALLEPLQVLMEVALVLEEHLGRNITPRLRERRVGVTKLPCTVRMVGSDSTLVV